MKQGVKPAESGAGGRGGAPPPVSWVAYVPYALAAFVLLTVMGLRMQFKTDFGLARVERIWRGQGILTSKVEQGFDDAHLAAELNVEPRDVNQAEHVVDGFLDKLDRQSSRPMVHLVSLQVGDMELFLGQEVILNLAFAGLVGWLFAVRARLRNSLNQLDTQRSKQGKLNEELEAKVAESRRVIDKLNTLQDKLVEAEKLASIGRLAATLAHEIRNPLTIIKSSTEIVADGAPEGSGAGAALAVIQEEVARMDRIISDLLNFARPKPPDVMVHNVKSLIRHWLPPVVEELEKDHVQLVPQFENFAGDVVVDADQLYQVFLNIVWNARDALAGVPRPHIFVRTEEAGPNFCRLTIQDTGAGMIPEMLQQVREPFFTTKTKGTGIGLSISVQLIEGMGGRLTIDSELEVGTTVALFLPRADSSARPRGSSAVVVRYEDLETERALELEKAGKSRERQGNPGKAPEIDPGY